ncbi:hypothetical protein Halar_0364 (plasmid) [halophilic archaeon DL31]|jgi:hypothetical protein|nr:hypothetical protein Halar_0364 [halophilic archaeon DL31]
MPDINRRKLLKSIGAAAGASAFGLGTAQAKTDDQSTNEDILLTFDPENQKEVRKAYRQLSSLPNKRAVEKIIEKLSHAQVTALREVNKHTEVVTVLEASDGTQYQVSGDDESVGVKQAESLVSISSVGDNTVTAVSKLKNWAGTTEATFKHHVYWEYDGTNVMKESHWHEASTAVLYDFDGVSTNYLDNRGDEAVSRKIADFSSCLGGPCVTKQLGTEIWMFENGGWTVNEL